MKNKMTFERRVFFTGMLPNALSAAFIYLYSTFIMQVDSNVMLQCLIVFLIFTYLGVKFIKEAFEKKEKENLCIGLSCLFLIGIATSIDAFSAGISLSLYGNKILKPVLLITFITFVNSLIGFWLGGKLKKFPTKSMEIFAGIVLIFLGIKAIL